MGNKRSLVSIILPTYNRAHLLLKAVDSVLAQSYQNWELLLWNDGSTDETQEVMATISDPRVRCFSEENNGKSYVLNHCLELARGELIAFLDDDDQWLPRKLQIQVEVMSRWQEIDLVFGNYINVNIENQTEDIAFDQGAEGLAKLDVQKVDKNWWSIDHGFLEGITRSNFIAFDSVIIRSAIIKKIGFFNENLRTSEDFEYWWRFGLAGLKAAFTDEIIMNRIKHPGSLSGRRIESALNRLKTLDTCKTLAIAEGRTDFIRLLTPQYRNTWQNLIALYGHEGKKEEMINAFRESIKFGLRPGSVELLVQGLLTSVHDI